jgi:hypothetical protein
MVAGGEGTSSVIEPALPFGRSAGVQFGTKRLEFGLQTVIAAQVVAKHVQHAPAAPELFAVLQFVNDRWPIRRMVGPDHDEKAHAESDETARHPAQHQDRHGYRSPDPRHRDLDHVRWRGNFRANRSASRGPDVCAGNCVNTSPLLFPAGSRSSRSQSCRLGSYDRIDDDRNA